MRKQDMKEEQKALPTEEEDDEEEINYEIEGKYSLQKLVEGNEAWSEIES
jgi:hypothetical protein